MVRRGFQHGKTVTVIQARMGSTRFPGKCMADLCGKTVLSRLIDRVKASEYSDEICVATTVLDRDDIIAEEAGKKGVAVYRGDERNVLSRYCGSAKMTGARNIIRVTADNPLTDPRYMDRCMSVMISEDLDYVAMSNIPYGSNVETVSTGALEIAERYADDNEKEHVTLYVNRSPERFKVKWIEPEDDEKRPDIRITLDTVEDYDLLRKVFSHFRGVPDEGIDLKEVIKLIDGWNRQ